MILLRVLSLVCEHTLKHCSLSDLLFHGEAREYQSYAQWLFIKNILLTITNYCLNKLPEHFFALTCLPSTCDLAFSFTLTVI